MSFVLDTDACSAYLKSDRRVEARFMQYTGGLYVSTITVAELRTWSRRANAPARRDQSVDAMLVAVYSIPVDDAIATRCGEVRAEMLDRGVVIATTDLLIASTALLHNYTLVTHNTGHFAPIPGLDKRTG